MPTDAEFNLVVTANALLWPFVLLFVFRYLRTVVSIFTYATYRPVPIRDIPIYTSKDVEVIIPTTYKDPPKLIECLFRILGNRPTAVHVVSSNDNVRLIRNACYAKGIGHVIRVYGVDKLNKRHQILRAIDFVHEPITVLADDDVFWPGPDYLQRLVAVFEHSSVVAGGTRQRVKRDEKPGAWNFLGVSYLERRVWNNVATNAIDGSISTLSGRTAAYRTLILKNDEFKHYFTNDKWRGKPLNSDDDKCLTRWAYSQKVYAGGNRIVLQFDPRAIIETTVEGDRKYLKQCMR